MNPVFLEIGSFQLRFFGLFYAAGLIILYLILRKDIRQTGIKLSREELLDWIVIVFFYGVVGARLYYVLFNIEYYTSEDVPWYEFLTIWHGGMSLNGGFITAPLALWLMCKYKKIQFGKVADLIVVPLLLTQSLVRIGNFMNGDEYGLPTHHFWGVVFEHGPASREYPGIALHPIMLYEVALNIAALFILVIIKKSRLAYGFTAACYLIFYSIIRFTISLFSSSDMIIAGFHEPRVVAILGIIISISIIFAFQLHKYSPPEDSQQYPSTRDWTI